MKKLTSLFLLLVFLCFSTSSCRDGVVRELISKKDTWKQAYVYGFPMVMNYGVMYAYAIDRNSGQFKAPFNQIYNEARVFTPADTAIITPNSDTPYSFLFMDLRAEPLVLCLPAVEKNRYFSVMLNDMYTFNYGYMGSRATGSDAGCYMVAGPDWKGDAPAGIKKVFHSETQFSAAAYRTQLFNPKDMPNVKKIQAGYTVQPLSAFLHQPAPPPAPAIDFPAFDKEDMKLPFPKYLNFVLQFCPVQPEDKELRDRMAEVGIVPGQPFDPDKLSEFDKAEEALGIEEGYKEIKGKVETVGKKINGWSVASVFGDRSFYKGDWLLRAAGAAAGIYGNDAIEAMYPITRVDGSGNKLDGSKHNYTLTFAAGQLPPVNAFWSVTMYDGNTQLLIANPINRYLINAPMLPQLKKNADGSLTLYIQKNAPAGDQKANWLPAPDGPIYLVMRLYWPKTEQPSILPAGDGTWKPPAVMVAE
jgi:hypothetical protein